MLFQSFLRSVLWYGDDFLLPLALYCGSEGTICRAMSHGKQQRQLLNCRCYINAGARLDPFLCFYNDLLQLLGREYAEMARLRSWSIYYAMLCYAGRGAVSLPCDNGYNPEVFGRFFVATERKKVVGR